jgi:hypothetical protein
MASTLPKVVLISPNSEDGSRPIQKDGLAGESILPGQILKVHTDETILKHTTAAGVAHPVMLSVENPYSSDPTVSQLEAPYATGDNVRYIYPQSGDLVYAFVKAAAVLVKGITLLVSDGAGALQAQVVDATTLTGAVIARAEEDVTVGASATRQLVRIV